MGPYSKRWLQQSCERLSLILQYNFLYDSKLPYTMMTARSVSTTYCILCSKLDCLKYLSKVLVGWCQWTVVTMLSIWRLSKEYVWGARFTVTQNQGHPKQIKPHDFQSCSMEHYIVNYNTTSLLHQIFTLTGSSQSVVLQHVCSAVNKM